MIRIFEERCLIGYWVYMKLSVETCKFRRYDTQDYFCRFTTRHKICEAHLHDYTQRKLHLITDSIFTLLRLVTKFVTSCIDLKFAMDFTTRENLWRVVECESIEH